MVGLRGAVAPAAGLFTRAACEIAEILRTEGVADMPIGVDIVEPPMLAALQDARHHGPRRAASDARRTREIKSADEIQGC